MKKLKVATCLVFLLGLAGPVWGQKAVESSGQDQAELKVTVYNSNLALISDTRNVTLPIGQGELRFMDIASHVMPETVHARSLNHPDGFAVLEQDYLYDLMNSNALLDRYVGKKLKLVVWNKPQDRKEIVEATLLSNYQGQIYEIDGEIYLGHPGNIVLPGTPQDFTAKPTLSWLYENRKEKPHQIEVSYLTTNLNWKADYVMVLDKNETFSDLLGWATIDNKSGAIYKNALLKLVAGAVHRIEKKPPEGVYAMEAMKEARGPQFKETPMFEYYSYDMQRRTTIKDKQIKQISLIEAANIEVHKEFVLQGARDFFMRPYVEQTKQPLNAFIKFMNSTETGLGVPLPGGVGRVYKRDDMGGQQFIGEDRVEHTPVNEEVALSVGEVFDVSAERIQTDYRQISARLHESEWEITIKNQKDKDVKISIVEPLFGNWKVMNSSHPYKKTDAFTIEFDVSVPKDGEEKVKYRVKVGL
jgi:hypothetical protein